MNEVLMFIRNVGKYTKTERKFCFRLEGFLIYWNIFFIFLLNCIIAITVSIIGNIWQYRRCPKSNYIALLLSLYFSQYSLSVSCGKYKLYMSAFKWQITIFCHLYKICVDWNKNSFSEWQIHESPLCVAFLYSLPSNSFFLMSLIWRFPRLIKGKN